MIENSDNLKKELELLAKLGPPKVYVPPQFDDGQTQCICGQWKPNAELEEVDSGIVMALSNVCRSCVEGRKLDRETARIVCVGCRRVVARVAPCKDTTGFRFEANRCYHIQSCPVCNSDVKESHILEKVLHDRDLGRKI